MAKEISPVVPALPPTTAIQDPAVRNFCRAVADALKSIQSPESSVAALTQALESVAGGSSGPATTVGGNSGQYGVPQFTVNSILRSRLFGALSRTIDRIPLNADSNAEELVAAEASARQAAIDALNARVTSLENAAVYDPAVTYNEGDIVQYDGGLYQANATTTGNLPTNATYWDKIGDYASIGDAVAALAAEVEEHDTRITNNGTAITAEATSRNTLAVQLRGNYTGTDVNALSQGLIHSERQARVSAVDAVTTTLNTQISRIDAAEAAITSEATTRAGNDTALVQAINTAWAITGATQAVQQVGSNLVTNWTTAQANYWNQLDAEVFTAGGQTIRAALSQEATARATQTGELFGQWTVKLDLNGYVAGFGLASESTIAGGTTSSFIIRADSFALVPPGATSGQPGARPFDVNSDGSLAPASGFSSSAYSTSTGWSMNKDGTFSANGAGNQILMTPGGSRIIFNKPAGAGVSFAVDETGNAIFGGTLMAAGGTFAGQLQAGVLDPSAFAGIVLEYQSPGVFSISAPSLPAGWSAMSLRATILAGGAGGGSTFGRLASGDGAAGGGGGGGAGQLINVIAHNITPGTAVQVTVGSGGAGGSGWSGGFHPTYGWGFFGAQGVAGGISRVSVSGTIIGTATGGVGGGGGFVGTDGQGSKGGIGGSIGGQTGEEGVYMSATTGKGGRGGSSEYGSGGAQSSGAGVAASGRGAGGGGAGQITTYGVIAGGSGSGGLVRLEFFDPNSVVTNTRYSNLITWLDTIGHGSVPSNAR